MKSLRGKILIWTSRLRVFCDGGQPIWSVKPKFRRMNYSPYWGMRGFVITVFGREFNMSFGLDKRGLYRGIAHKMYTHTYVSKAELEIYKGCVGETPRKLELNKDYEEVDNTTIKLKG